MSPSPLSPKEALDILITASPLSEEQKTAFITALPHLSPEDIQALGKIFAHAVREEQRTLEELSRLLAKAEVALTPTPQTPDEDEE